jgi:hypothetical protein
VSTGAQRLAHVAALTLCLAAIAWASPLPQRVTDRDVYEATAAHGVVFDCSDLHCFRVLVPWLLAPLPGPSLLKWKAYAVLSNVAAGVAVFALCFTFGLSRRAAWYASIGSAFGFGSLYTLHDVYSSDPLMYFLGPFLTNELLSGRVVVAAAVGAIGVLAKEFAAAPLYLVSGYQAVERQWVQSARAFVAANAVFAVWLLMTLILMLRYNYTYSGSASADLAGGGNLVGWMSRLSGRGIAAAMFNEFGALWVLAPVGFFLAPRRLQLIAIVSLPIAALFGYVQQPDRALWNFHFIVVPLAAIVLDRAAALAWPTLTAFVIGNLRVGAQLPIAPVGRLAMAASVLFAFATAAVALRPPRGVMRSGDGVDPLAHSHTG